MPPIVLAEQTEEPKQEARHHFDHFVVGIADLDEGMALIEKLTGVRPVYGGVHPSIGTHNALISLGDHTYLEIIAPNPDADFENLDSALKATYMEPLKQMTTVTLFLWAVGSDNLYGTGKSLQAAGLELSAPSAGSRKKPDGTLLTWQSAYITEPGSAEFPFFIRWGDATASPAEDSPKGCLFKRFAVSGPDTLALKKLTNQLGLAVEVNTASDSKFQLRLDCPKGGVALK